jgi:uncharacterized membrane protein YbhN (UPF0104 family)
MRISRQSWWRVGKVLLTLAILASVGWQFGRILLDDDLWRSGIRVRPGWALAAALLYLLGLGCSALFWDRLLRVLGQRPSLLGVLRAFYVGQLARYVPGKVVGIVVRARLLSGAGVSNGMAVLTIIYEALTTLTAAALLAAVLLPLRGTDFAGMRWQSLGLLVLISLVLLPAVFNRVVRRVAPPLPEEGPAPRQVRSSTLALGLAMTVCGWGLQGASLWAMLQAILPEPQAWDWAAWADDTASSPWPR